MPSQLSVADALKVTLDEQDPGKLHTFVFPGQVTTGFSQSATTTLNPHDVCKPAPSVTVQATGVDPIGNLAGPVVGTATGWPVASLVVHARVLLSQVPPRVVITMVGLR